MIDLMIRGGELIDGTGAPARGPMDIVVEARSSRPYGRQRIEAWHVPTASWRLLDERAVSIEDLVVLLPNIAAPGEYVDPVGNAVRLRDSVEARLGPSPTTIRRNVRCALSCAIACSKMSTPFTGVNRAYCCVKYPPGILPHPKAQGFAHT